MTVGVIVAIAGAAIGAMGLAVAVVSYLGNRGRTRRDMSIQDFLETLRFVRKEQSKLQVLTYEIAPVAHKGTATDRFSLLTKHGWILDHPIPLDNVHCEYDPLESDPARWQATRLEASKILPKLPGKEPLTYSRALIELDGRKLRDGFSYHLRNVNVSEDEVELVFGEGSYCKYIDTGEVLAYEAGRAWLPRTKSLGPLSLRKKMGSPFDFGNRMTSCGVVTLTLRRSSTGTGFYLHKRHPKATEVGYGQLHAVPAGEFQPSGISLDAIRTDFSLWRNIVREYAEEFLGVPEAIGREQALDFGQWPYRELIEAANDGAIRCYFLGLGLDPLTWKPEILTVCVFESDVFDFIFRDALLKLRAPDDHDETTEGTILCGAAATGIPFDQEHVDRYLGGDMRDAGKACLSLAWHHRTVLVSGTHIGT
jgi:hypothetical protein